MRELLHITQDGLRLEYNQLLNGYIHVTQKYDEFLSEYFCNAIPDEIYLNKEAARALYNRLGRSLEEMDESKITGEEGFDRAD